MELSALSNHGFLEPQIADYEYLFKDNDARMRGGSIDQIRYYVPDYISNRRRAGGIFSYFTKSVIPWIRPIAFRFISNVMGDMADGNTSVKDSLKKHGLSSVSEAFKKARGGKIRKRRSTSRKKRNPIKKKRKTRKVQKRSKEDIFSMLK